MDKRLERTRGPVAGDAPAPIRVLLIEDNPADALAIEQALAAAGQAASAGAAMATLERAERLGAAIARLAREDIDLIPLDLGLPDSQGLDTLARLRPAAPHTPIVVLGDDDEGTSLLALRQGAQDYLVKNPIGGVIDGAGIRRTALFALQRSRLS